MKSSLLALLVVSAACGPKPSAPPVAPVPAPTPVATPTPTAAPPSLPAPAPVVTPPSVTFLAACRAQLEQGRAAMRGVLAATGPRTIASTLEPFDEGWRFLRNASNQAGLAQQVEPDKDVREAAQLCEREIQLYISTLMLDRTMFDAIAAVDVSKADADTKRYHRITLRDYKRAGVDLADAQRARIQAIDDEVTRLGQQHSENIAGDTRFIEVTDRARLAGMPADWIAAHKPDAKGAIRITTDYPDYIPFITYATDDALRKELYIKFKSRGDKDNEAVLAKLLALRAEKAKLLGFKDWADYQSDDKMLKGGKAAAAFIERVTKLARPRAKRDYAELLAQLKKTDPKATSVGDWQKAWLEDQVKKSAYNLDTSEVRKYFAFDNVLGGLLAITSEIYDIQYTPVTDARVWHPSVKVYDVRRGTEVLGRIYLDLHPRENKYKHAAQFAIKDGVIGKQLPEGALVCNFSDPSVSTPALMDHDQVVTMFHEFGHLMHHVLGGKHRWTSQTGVATEWDFVEAPSQMFEEWGWSYETLSRFAKHVDTGAVIPKDLVAKLNTARTFGVGSLAAQQMFYAAIALRFHQVDPATLDQLATVKALQAKYTPFGYVEGTRFHTSFGHLVGYSSMYYTYMWSLVIAKDLLTPFAKRGLLDTTTTKKYRDAILAPGGTKDAAELVKDFLGRPYDFKAFEKYLKS